MSKLNGGAGPASAPTLTPQHAKLIDDSSIPTAEELFGPRPFQSGSIEIEDADLSPAMELANRECARLIVNCCFFDPPIEEAEIDAYARRFGLARREAELEVRRQRYDS